MALVNRDGLLKRVDGLAMVLRFSDADPRAECECGWTHQGDSINETVLEWTKHVTSTPECRDKL